MADIIKMNYPLMDDMAQAFAQGSEMLETALSEVNSIAQLIADGALLGLGGDAFEEACRNTLATRLRKMMEKFNELQQDILSAKESMMGADSNVTQFMG